MLLADPFSAGGLTPHFPSDSSGSNTCTPPSVRPKANWFGSEGCAAITTGYTVVLSKQVGSYQKQWIMWKTVQPQSDAESYAGKTADGLKEQASHFLATC